MDTVFLTILNVREGLNFGEYQDILVFENKESALAQLEENKNYYIDNFKDCYNDDYFEVEDYDECSCEIHSKEYEDMVTTFVTEKKILK